MSYSSFIGCNNYNLYEHKIEQLFIIRDYRTMLYIMIFQSIIDDIIIQYNSSIDLLYIENITIYRYNFMNYTMYLLNTDTRFLPYEYY